MLEQGARLAHFALLQKCGPQVSIEIGHHELVRLDAGQDGAGMLTRPLRFRNPALQDTLEKDEIDPSLGEDAIVARRLGSEDCLLERPFRKRSGRVSMPAPS